MHAEVKELLKNACPSDLLVRSCLIKQLRSFLNSAQIITIHLSDSLVLHLNQCLCLDQTDDLHDMTDVVCKHYANNVFPSFKILYVDYYVCVKYFSFVFVFIYFSTVHGQQRELVDTYLSTNSLSLLENLKYSNCYTIL